MREMHEPVEQVFKHVRVGRDDRDVGKAGPLGILLAHRRFLFRRAQQGRAGNLTNALAVGSRPAPRDKPETGGRRQLGLRAFGTRTPRPDRGRRPHRRTRRRTPLRRRVDCRPAGEPPAPMPLIRRPRQHACCPERVPCPCCSRSGFPSTRSMGPQLPETAIRQLIEGTPRRVTLGSTPEQIRAAFALCKQYSSACQLSWYGDEGLRNVTLDPFELDPLPVSVQGVSGIRGRHAATRPKPRQQVSPTPWSRARCSP